MKLKQCQNHYDRSTNKNLIYLKSTIWQFLDTMIHNYKQKHFWYYKYKTTTNRNNNAQNNLAICRGYMKKPNVFLGPGLEGLAPD